MAKIDESDLVPLYSEEEQAFRLKEKWQRRAIAWFGVATGIAFALEFARSYYYLLASRYTVPDMADTSHLDLEFNAILGIIVGLLIAVLPVVLAYVMGKRAPQAFAARKFENGKAGAWITAILTVIVAIAEIVLGVLFVIGAFRFRAEPGVGGMEMVVLFGSLLIAIPLLAEGFWSINAIKKGIEQVYVLRKDKWRKR